MQPARLAQIRRDIVLGKSIFGAPRFSPYRTLRSSSPIRRFALYPPTILRKAYGATGRLGFVTLLPITNHQSPSLRHGVRRNPAGLDHTSLSGPDPAPIFQGQQTDTHDDDLAGDKG
jgi:hypothetical protein